MGASRAHATVLAVCICVLCSSALPRLAGQATAAFPQSSAAPADNDFPQVLVTVSDADGNPGPVPSKESLQVTVGGKAAQVEGVRSLKGAPLFFSLVVDVSGSSRQFGDHEVATASRLFDELSAPDNKGYLILFSSGVVTNDRPLSAPVVRQVLSRFTDRTRSGGTALYDAVIHAATRQLSVTRVPGNSRRAIIAFSDGGDNSSGTNLDDTVKIMQKAGVPIFAIGFSRHQQSQDQREGEFDLRILQTLSHATGGSVSFLDDSDDVVGHVAQLLESQCLLSFNPVQSKAKKSYRLKITSTAEGMRLLAPEQYFAP